ncbi:hypothetical protein [Vagococcus sp.]|uniref:hypothetical protein n=1 Tax=Vagococcus sp. TaxID=1933889 RepID=UPI003F9DCBF2
MKKIISIVSLGLLMVALGACGNQKKETTPSQTETSTSDVKPLSDSTSSSEDKERKVSILEGTIESVGEQSLTLTAIEGVTDPEDVANMFQTDGVIVKLTAEVLETANLDMSSFKKGDRVQMGILEGAPVTQSLPPQVTAESIKLAK